MARFMKGNLAQPATPFSRARTIVRRHGRSALDHFKLLPDKSLFFSKDRRAFLAYRVSLGTAVVLGDPVGPDGSIEPLLGQFLARFEGRGRSVVFLQIGSTGHDRYRTLGLSLVRIGANAIIDLNRFDLLSPRAKTLRSALRRVRREGLAVKRVEPPLSKHLIDRLAETNASWLGIPGRIERGFSAGRFDRETLRCSPLSLLESPDGRIAAFVSWIPSYVAGEATVDLIRRRSDAPSYALDALVTSAIVDARRRGYARFDLGLAPLARLDDGPIGHPAERILRWIFRYGGPRLGHAGLYAWKAKFDPVWTAQWLAYRGGPLAFARASWALRRVVRAPQPPFRSTRPAEDSRDDAFAKASAKSQNG